MASVKEAMSEIIARQPDDSSFDEILRELAYARMIERGLDDVKNQRTLSNAEVQQKIAAWQS